jgi:hypothetical protein
MTTSRDDALVLLSGFKTNSSSVAALIGTAFGKFFFECRVVDVGLDTVMLEQYPSSKILEGRPVRSIILLNAVAEFSYGDIREADLQVRQFLQGKFAEVLGVLTLYYTDMDRLLIVEYADTWRDA